MLTLPAGTLPVAQERGRQVRLGPVLSPCRQPNPSFTPPTNLRFSLVSATDDVVKVEVWDVVDKGEVHLLSGSIPPSCAYYLGLGCSPALCPTEDLPHPVMCLALEGLGVLLCAFWSSVQLVSASSSEQDGVWHGPTGSAP